MMNPVFVGTDVGASCTKVVILDKNKKLIGYSISKSGIDFSQTAEKCLESSLKMAKVNRTDIVKTVSTGYGRNNVLYSDVAKTEISCHANGCFFYYPMPITIIDIGGQDNKIIKVDKTGKRSSFKMNRKCAAGTGAFIEEMSLRLNIPIEEMNDLAYKAEKIIELGSFCTVFSATEVLEKIREGHKVENIIKGLFLSVIKRVMEMDSLTENVVLTGGVIAHNPIIVDIFEEKIGRKILVTEYPQLTGAIGSALYAIDGFSFN